VAKTKVPEPPPLTEPDRAYQGAVTGADAYRTVRGAVRLHGEVLRIGNRFVDVGQFREIAFLAVGRAAVSCGFAVVDALGDRLTQGFLAGPDEVPEKIPFLHRRTTSEALGSPDAGPVVESALEMAAGLSAKDLLIVAISPGALGLLAAPPAGLGPSAYREIVDRLRAAGASGPEMERFVRVTAGGLVGGRLTAASPTARVVPLLVDRGGATEAAGGGPTRPVEPAEIVAVRSMLSERGIPDSGGPEIRRALDAAPVKATRIAPVMVAGPADALQGAGDALSETLWWSRLAALALPGGIDAAAQEFNDRVEEILKEIPRTRERRKGVAIFAGAPLDCLDGEGEGEAIARLLPALRTHARRRDLQFAAFRTAGARPGDLGTPAGVLGTTGTSIEPILSYRAGHPGVTDVGPVVMALRVEPPRA
jgi:glycerate-2-kinase